MPWLLRLDPSQLGFVVEPKLLARTMMGHTMREWHRVRRCFTAVTPDIAGGRETITHLLRSYALLLQLVDHGRVLDYRAAEPVRQELRGYAAIEWTWWRDKFEPRIAALANELRAAARRADEVSL